MNVTWSEFQYGEFDPASSDYDNTDWLIDYFTIDFPLASRPSYSIEYSQKHLDLQVFYVWQPLKPLAVSIGGGGLVGLYTNYIKMKNFPIYIGPIDPTLNEPIFSADDTFWIRQDVVMEGGPALSYGPLATIKIEYFLSPRFVLSLNATYRKFFSRLAYSYTFGGFSAGPNDKFYQLSGWMPGKTPYGDDVDISFHSIGVYLGISGSF